MHRCLMAACLTLALCRGQEGSLATFGTTVVVPGGLTGKIYHIPTGSAQLPKFQKLEPVGTIYTKGVFISPREFSEGFPGITDRIEWFALDFTGRIYIDNPGSYAFNLCSDDGSKLYIDGKTVIDNDGVHSTRCETGGVKLAGGIHTIRLSYFQGPRYSLSLMLGVSGPKEKLFRPFNTDEFQPPANPADWKYGSPESLPAAPNPDAGRTRLRDVIRRTDPVVSTLVQVLSRGMPVRDLKASDFQVRDDGQAQEIIACEFAALPQDIMLLVDAGTDMGRLHERLKAAAPSAVTQLAAGDRLGVARFVENPGLLLGPASVPDLMVSAIRRIQPVAGEKDIYAAVALTARYLKENARPDAGRAIVILTGNRGRQTISERATRDALLLGNVTLSGLLPVDAADGGVRAFIDATGGEALTTDGTDLPLGQLLRSLRSRYRITWRAPGGASKSIRRIGVELSGEARARIPAAAIRVPAAYVVE